MGKLWVLVLILMLSVGCARDDRSSLVVYSPHGKEMLSDYEHAFEAANPDVDIQWIDMGGQNVYDRVRTERQNPQASIWWGGDGPTFNRAASEGLLEVYRPSWADAVAEANRNRDDFWYGTFLTPEIILYNSRTVSEGEQPLDWDDLLKPEWEGKIIIRYPLASSTMRTIWGALIMRQPTEEDGYAWLARLDRNTKTYAADPTQLYLKIAREEGEVSLWNMPDTYIQSELNGYPFGFSIPLSGTPVLTDAIAIVAGGAHPDIARRFYEFVTSDSALVSQANKYFRIPVRNDLDTSLLPDWMAASNIPHMEVDWERLTTEGARWMQHWDEFIKGRGGKYLADRGLD